MTQICDLPPGSINDIANEHNLTVHWPEKHTRRDCALYTGEALILFVHLVAAKWLKWTSVESECHVVSRNEGSFRHVQLVQLNVWWKRRALEARKGLSVSRSRTHLDSHATRTCVLYAVLWTLIKKKRRKKKLSDFLIAISHFGHRMLGTQGILCFWWYHIQYVYS